MAVNDKILVLLRGDGAPIVFSGKEKIFRAAEISLGKNKLSPGTEELQLFRIFCTDEGFSIATMQEEIDIFVNDDLLMTEYPLRDGDRLSLYDLDAEFRVKYSDALTAGSGYIILPADAAPAKTHKDSTMKEGPKKILGMSPVIAYIAFGMAALLIIVVVLGSISGASGDKMPYVVFNQSDRIFIQENRSFYMLADLSDTSFLAFHPDDSAEIEGRPSLEDSAAAFTEYSNVLMGLETGGRDLRSLMLSHSELMKAYKTLRSYSIKPAFYRGLVDEIGNIRSATFDEYETKVRRVVMLYSEAVRTEDENTENARIREVTAIIGDLMAAFPDDMQKTERYAVLKKMNSIVAAFAHKNKIQLAGEERN